MHKTLCIAGLILGVFAPTASRSADPPSAIETPRISAHIRLLGQTQTIPTTTLLNVSQNGVYRVTTYLSQTSPGPQGAGENVQVSYTDGAGAENYYAASTNAYYVPPYAYGLSPAADTANSFTFNALAGTAITYSVLGYPAGTYDLFIVVERLV